MSDSTVRRSPILRQIETYQESWKTDHSVAMSCADLEELIAIGISVFDVIENDLYRWREEVETGKIEFQQQSEDFKKLVLAIMIETTEGGFERCIKGLEKHYGDVRGAKELRDRTVNARIALERWESPRLSSAIGLRTMTLTQKEVERMRERSRKTMPVEGTACLPEVTMEQFLARRK